MKIVYFALTRQGNDLALQLCAGLPGQIVTKEVLREKNRSLHDLVRELWTRADGLVFIMAAGIVVRTIASLLKSKTSDPAVVVMDAAGRFAVSLLSGHLGGANALAAQLAGLCGGQAVITTGTDVANTVAFDVFAREQGCRIENIRELKYISAAMIEGEPVHVFSPWPGVPPFPENVRVHVPEGTGGVCHAAGSIEGGADAQMEYGAAGGIEGARAALSKSGSAAVFIGHKYDEGKPFCGGLEDMAHRLFLRPRNLFIGVGCKRNVDSAAMAGTFEDFLEKNQIKAADVAGLATIGLKMDEPAIGSLCRQYGLELIEIKKEQIDALEAAGALTLTSEFVRRATGVGSVSEGCAIASAAGALLPDTSPGDGREEMAGVPKPADAPGQVRLICPKTKYTGITFALAERVPWRQSAGTASSGFHVQ